MIIRISKESADRNPAGDQELPPFWDLEALIREGHDFTTALDVLATRRTHGEGDPCASHAALVAPRVIERVASATPEAFDLSETRRSA